MRSRVKASIAFALVLVTGAFAFSCATSLNLGTDGADGGDGGAGSSGGNGDGSALTDSSSGGNGEGGNAGNDGSPVGDGAATGNAPKLVASSQYNSCAITPAGAVMCWGDDTFGQLGDGNNNNPGSFVPSPALILTSGVTQVVARYNHYCALNSGGAVSCWGQSLAGETGTAGDTATPSQVPTLGIGVMTISAGQNHTCAILVGGAVSCWGSNGNGQLGNGTSDLNTHVTPVTATISGVTAIATGANHTCAVTNHAVKCWGSDSQDQVGPGFTADQHTPVDVPGTAGTVDITASDNTTCALDAAGEVKCWGEPLGPYTLSTWTPAGLVALVPGGECHMCGLKANGALSCWGCDTDGELGDDQQSGGTGPAGPPSSLTFTSAAGGELHTCGVVPGGAVMCWGEDDNGRCGNNTTLPQSLEPTIVAGFPL